MIIKYDISFYIKVIDKIFRFVLDNRLYLFYLFFNFFLKNRSKKIYIVV